jgi:hypothetical protein
LSETKLYFLCLKFIRIATFVKPIFLENKVQNFFFAEMKFKLYLKIILSCLIFSGLKLFEDYKPSQKIFNKVFKSDRE